VLVGASIVGQTTSPGLSGTLTLEGLFINPTGTIDIRNGATLVSGSHGLLPEAPEHGPIFICSEPFGACGGEPEGSVEWASFRDRALSLMELG
jgi:hypothetical protein